MLESPDESQPELGLQGGERFARKASGAAVPGASIGIERVAEREVERGSTFVGRQGHMGRGVGHLPNLGDRPPGVDGDLAEGGEGLACNGPAQAVLPPRGHLVWRHGSAAGETDIVDPAEHCDSFSHAQTDNCGLLSSYAQGRRSSPPVPEPPVW